MALDLVYPHIEKPEAAAARLKRLPRVRVAQIVSDYLAHGWSPGEICRQHPYLLPAEVHASLTYYFDHQEEVDREVRSEWETAQRDKAVAAPTPFVLKMKLRGLL
jgi:hypothetical protein